MMTIPDEVGAGVNRVTVPCMREPAEFVEVGVVRTEVVRVEKPNTSAMID